MKILPAQDTAFIPRSQSPSQSSILYASDSISNGSAITSTEDPPSLTMTLLLTGVNSLFAVVESGNVISMITSAGIAIARGEEAFESISIGIASWMTDSFIGQPLTLTHIKKGKAALSEKRKENCGG
jgi:hypothetical protein